MQLVFDGYFKFILTKQRVHESDRGRSVSLVTKLDEGELRGAIDPDIEAQLASLGANLGDVDVEVAYRVDPELLRGRPVAGHVGQPADAVVLDAAVQG